MPPAPPRTLRHAESISATVREVLIEAASTAELTVWCSELADKIDQYERLQPAEKDALERGASEERIADLERELAEVQRLASESAKHWQEHVASLEARLDQSVPVESALDHSSEIVSELQGKLQICESMVVPLLGVQQRVIKMMHTLGKLPAEVAPTTDDVIAWLDASIKT